MTYVPPTGSPGGSSSSRSEGPSHKKKKEKDFSLPKVHEKQEKKEDKKLEQPEVGGKEVSPQFQGVSTPSKTEGTTGIGKINELISKLISEMHTGTLGGKQITSMNLKVAADIPTAFQNTSLTIVQTQAGLIVNFSNFNTTKQEADALTLIKENQAQLGELVRVLAAKNISIAEFQVGNTTIVLPKVETTSGLNLSPLRAGETGETTFRREREGGEGGQREGEEGEGRQRR